MEYSGLLEGLHHSQSNAAKAGGMDEQEKKWLLGTVLRFQREYPPRLVGVRHYSVCTGFQVTFFFVSGVTELVILIRLCTSVV
jgi:hypothetical protein